jgi:8-amino-7-oxononanoate synthase
MRQALTGQLDRRRADGLWRERRLLEGPQAVEAVIDGRRCLAFCSNDYLALANDPRVIAAMQDGAARYGAGSGASHLVNGHSRAHHELEAALADFTGRPRALLFSTGYMANVGTLDALAGRGDRIYADRLVHASLLDGARLSGARLRRYPHANTGPLAAWLQQDGGSGRRLIVTDGVFSMDGDVAPLPALAALAARHDAWLLVDDAHGLGVIGPDGRGVLGHFGLDAAQVPVLVGTLGKAFGCFGAFVAGSGELVDTLIQFARSYIYTTALPPAAACAALAALEISQREPWRRERLQALVERFESGARRLGLALPARAGGVPATPIVPLIVGDSERALALSQRLLDRGILIGAIRPPTVARGSARLRITFSAAHSEAHVDRLLDALAEAMPR